MALSMLQPQDPVTRRRSEWHDPPLEPFQLQRALRYFTAHLREPFNHRAWANVVGLSPFYCGRRFRATTGQTPQQYLGHLRIARAQQYLLETRASVQEIARVVGYADPGWFAKLFHREVGLSPLRYRQTYQKAQSEEVCCPACLRPLTLMSEET